MQDLVGNKYVVLSNMKTSPHFSFGKSYYRNKSDLHKSIDLGLKNGLSILEYGTVTPGVGDYNIESQLSKNV